MGEKRQNDLTIGIVGVGMVGGALLAYFESKGIKPFLYDPHKIIGSKEEVNQAKVVFVCVPTPFVKENGLDLMHIQEHTLPWLTGEKIVVLKSTVLPGTTEQLQQEYPQHKFLFNPEFLVEEKAMQDMMHPDRQIVGHTKESRDVAQSILDMLPRAPYETIMPAKEAEVVKYFGNAFLALKVSFGNQMYELCQKLGVDYDTVRQAGSADPRIGPSHLDVFHGGYRGYGGRCLPKDVRAFLQIAHSLNVDMSIVEQAENFNNRLMAEQGIEDPEKLSKREGP